MPKLGPIQSFIVEKVNSMADYYRTQGADPQQAGVSVPMLYRACGGRYFGPELDRSAKALVKRGLLAVNKVGYGLPPKQRNAQAVP